MSTADKLIHFLFSHQLMLIEVLFGLILGLCVLWLFANLNKESDSTSSEKNLKDLERVLEKVIQKNGGIAAGAGGAAAPSAAAGAAAGSSAQQPLSANAEALLKMKIPEKGAGGPSMPGMPGSGMPGMGGGLPGKGPAPVAAAPGLAAAPAPQPLTTTPAAPKPTGPSPEQAAEMNKLKADNDTKTAKVAELEKAVSQAREELAKAKEASANSPKVNVDDLQQKIKTLEARLGEYEIIEDDIANLSLYKDENARLKDEMQKLRAGGGAGATAAPSPAPAPAPKAEAPKPPVAAAPAPTPAQTPAPTPAPASPVAPPDAPIDAAIDPNKLVAEVADLATQPVNDAKATAPADDKDSGDKLIEEFENFVKGGLGS